MISGIVTSILLLAFIGIWIWAWRGQRKTTFDEAARVPLHDNNIHSPRDRSKEPA
jgi:cytochrome c oxidase cbb3-type subunit IV